MSSLAATKAAETLSSLFAALSAKATGPARRMFRTWALETNIRRLYKRLWTVRFAKTFLDPDEQRDIFDFYYPLQLRSHANRRISVTTVADLPREANIVIEGSVGQGKSVFLRFLCASDMLIPGHIPVFIELRRIAASESLFDHILKTLATLAFPGIDADSFSALVSLGRMTLFLDGFDEVEESRRPQVLSEIDYLLRQHDGLRAIVSARLGSQIQHSALFQVYRLAPISKGEIADVIRRLLKKDRPLATELINAVDAHPGQVIDLLRTPLMITLMIVAYRADRRLPEQLVDFFDAVFAALLTRHDRQKPFDRKRRCGLSDSSIRSVFDALCFQWKKSGKPVLRETEVRAAANTAIKSCGLRCEVDDFLDDIVHTTALVVVEGGEYHFVHRSIQEYHAAAFVSGQAAESKRVFYRAMLNGRHRQWTQELDFLEQIDGFEYLKEFVIPALEEFVGTMTGNPTGATTIPSNDGLDALAAEFRCIRLQPSGFSLPWEGNLHQFIFLIQRRMKTKSGISILTCSAPLCEAVPESTTEVRTSNIARELLERPGTRQKFQEAISTVLVEAVAQLKDAKAIVVRERSRIEALSF